MLCEGPEKSIAETADKAFDGAAIIMPEKNRPTAAGRIIYLMGASGAGKDSLIDYALAHSGPETNFTVARRYLTRAGSEAGRHDKPVSSREFSRLERSGLLAMAWKSYNCSYGIGREIDSCLARGRDVIINGSRRYLAAARERYPELVAVLVKTAPHRRRLRLESRRRDKPRELAARLACEDSRFELPATEASHFHIISNDGPLDQAGERFIALLKRG